MTVACVSPRLRPRLLAPLAGLAALLTAGPIAAQFEGSNTPRDMPMPAAPSIPVFQPLPIFFPPTPPPLGRLVSRLASTSSGQTYAAPPELGLYLTESFYAPLSTRLARRTLDEKKREKLTAYRLARDTLLEELNLEIDRTRDTPPDVRRETLVALARRQTPRLAELEATAEQLRSELTTSETDWSALREWRLGQRSPRGDSPAELGAVLRAYAFYQSGLSLPQRALLREIVVEVTSGAEDVAAASAQQPFLFFSPSPTRVLLPTVLPAEAGTKIALFETKKSALKKELFDTVVAEDRATFAFTRVSAVKALAARQAVAFAELETLAEEIRLALVDLPALQPPVARSPLPPSLTQRTMTAVEARTALQKTSRVKVDAILATVPPDLPVMFTTTIDAQGAKVRLLPRPGARTRLSPNDPRVAAIVARINEVGEEHRLGNEALSRSIDDLRAEVRGVLGATATPQLIDQALDNVIRYNIQRENELGYRDYRTAVFEPGLSPEQRRLLFGGALRKLDLLLPAGELQPTRRPANW